jgi:hypothetical protein
MIKMENNNTNTIDEKDTNFIVVSIAISFTIIGIWLLAYYKLKDLSQSDRGTFGDMFGSVNALFSGLALAGIILTILLQRKELSLQRQELRDTREELKRSANAQEKSEKALNRQAENLKISAKLTALNTLVNYYSEQENIIKKSMPGRLDYGETAKKKLDYLSRIEAILERKENS